MRIIPSYLIAMQSAEGKITAFATAPPFAGIKYLRAVASRFKRKLGCTYALSKLARRPLLERGRMRHLPLYSSRCVSNPTRGSGCCKFSCEAEIRDRLTTCNLCCLVSTLIRTNPFYSDCEADCRGTCLLGKSLSLVATTLYAFITRYINIRCNFTYIFVQLMHINWSNETFVSFASSCIY